MDIKAELNYLRIAPRKVRLIADLIKGMDVRRAELELEHMTKRPAAELLKLLKSASANAEHNFNQHREDLYVKEMRVDPGPVLKRSMPRAFGRSGLIRKRTSHVRLELGIHGKDDESKLKVI